MSKLVYIIMALVIIVTTLSLVVVYLKGMNNRMPDVLVNLTFIAWAYIGLYHKIDSIKK